MGTGVKPPPPPPGVEFVDTPPPPPPGVEFLGETVADIPKQMAAPGSTRSRGEAIALTGARLLPDAAALAASAGMSAAAPILRSAMRVGGAAALGKGAELGIRGAFGDPSDSPKMEMLSAGLLGAGFEGGGRSIGRGLAFFLKPNASYGTVAAKRMEWMHEIGLSPTPDEASNWAILKEIRTWADKSAAGSAASAKHNIEARSKFEDIVLKTLRDAGSATGVEDALATGLSIRKAINAPGTPGGGYGIEGTYQRFKEDVGKRAFERIHKAADDSGVTIDMRDVLLSRLEDIKGRDAKLKEIFSTSLPEDPAVAKKIADLTREIETGKRIPVKDPATGLWRGEAESTPVDATVSFRDAHAYLTKLGESGEKADKELYGFLKDKLQGVSNANGFGKEFTNAWTDYKQGIDLYVREVLPSLLAKDPEKLIQGLRGATVTQWQALKDGLLRYDTGPEKVGRPVWEKVQRQVVHDIFMAEGNPGLSDMTKALDRLDKYSPKVKALIFDTPEAKQLLANVEQIAEAASNFRYLNPRGTQAGERLLTQEIQGAQLAMAGGTMVAGGAASGKTGLAARGATLLIMGIQRLGVGPTLSKIVYSPTATKYLTEGFKELNRGFWTKAGGLFAQAAHAAIDRENIRDLVRAGADAEVDSMATETPLTGKMAQPSSQ